MRRKYCAVCGERDESRFSEKTANRCRACNRAYSKDWRARNRVKWLAQNRLHQENWKRRQIEKERGWEQEDGSGQADTGRADEILQTMQYDSGPEADETGR